MSIKEETLRYWIVFGFKLGRMEFIWERSIPEAVQEFDKSLNELLFMLGDDFSPSQESFEAFSSQILMYYQRRDPEIYSSILIGICIQRYQLSLAVPEKHRIELRELAKSTLSGIPGSLIPDKEFLFSTIVNCGDAELQEVAGKIAESIDIMFEQNNKVTAKQPVVDYNTDNLSGYVFISYNSKDFKAVEKIKEVFRENGIECWIAPDSIPIGSEYTEVITDAIENCSAFVLVLSENSQKSVFVPKELDTALTAEKVIFPIHIDHSTLVKKMKFRLSNSQIVDASDLMEQNFLGIMRTIKEQLK